MEVEEQKRQVCGSLLEFNDGSLGFVPINSGVFLAGTAPVKVAVKVGDGPAGQQGQDWLNANVK